MYIVNRKKRIGSQKWLSVENHAGFELIEIVEKLSVNFNRNPNPYKPNKNNDDIYFRKSGSEYI